MDSTTEQIVKKEGRSMAQKVFSGQELITARPSGMDFAVYKRLQWYQGALLKQLFPGPSLRRVAGLMRPRVTPEYLTRQVLAARKKRIEADKAADEQLHNSQNAKVPMGLKLQRYFKRTLNELWQNLKK